MEYTAGTSWLHPHPISDLHDARATPNDDWKESTTNMSAGAGPSGTQQSSMDLSEFGLDQLPGEPGDSVSAGGRNSPTFYNSLGPSAAPTIPQQPSSYFNFPTHGNYFLSGDPVGSYNPTSNFRNWPTTPSIPLSNYSSLNGATNVAQNGPPQQQHQQSSSHAPQMMIECVDRLSHLVLC